MKDFIAVLPRYEWHQSMREDQEVLLQECVGYRMQTYLHVAVYTEDEAMAAIHRAFKQGVTDIVTFDYWSSKIEQQIESTRH